MGTEGEGTVFYGGAAILPQSASLNPGLLRYDSAMRYFQLQHPLGKPIRGDPFRSEADHLGVSETGHEHRLCSLHTSGGATVTVLAKRAANATSSANNGRTATLCQ